MAAIHSCGLLLQFSANSVIASRESTSRAPCSGFSTVPITDYAVWSHKHPLGMFAFTYVHHCILTCTQRLCQLSTESMWLIVIHCPCSLKLHNTLTARIHLLPQSLHQPFPTFTTQMLTNTTASTAHHSSVLCVHAAPHTPQSSTTTWTEIR